MKKRFSSIRKTDFANLTYSPIASTRATILSAVIDNLEMQLVPGIFWEQTLKILLGLPNILSRGQAPALSQSMDVCIHRK